MGSHDTLLGGDSAGADVSGDFAANEAREQGARHSDVVPKSASRAQTLPPEASDPFSELGLAEARVPHVESPQPGLRLPDETGSAWSSAYETSFEHAFASCERGDWLVPLVYAAGGNDERFGLALVRFGYEAALDLTDVEEALAVLEVAESTLHGTLGKDLCARIAENLIDEAYARFEQDRRFDRYFFCHSAAAIARLCAAVTQPGSARDAVEAIQSAAAALRVNDEHAETRVAALAGRCIREELGAPLVTRPSQSPQKKPS